MPTDDEVNAAIDALRDKAKRSVRGSSGHAWAAEAEIDRQAERLKQCLSDANAEEAAGDPDITVGVGPKSVDAHRNETPAPLSREQMIEMLTKALRHPGTIGCSSRVEVVLAALRAQAPPPEAPQYEKCDCDDPATCERNCDPAGPPPEAPEPPALVALRAKIAAMPTREEWLGGQRTKYLNRDEVLGWFDNQPAAPPVPPPAPVEPEPFVPVSAGSCAALRR